MTDDDNDGIGYGRPPKQHQFKPGQSGNPRGRPRGRRGLKSDLQQILSEKISITHEGRKRKITIQRGVLQALASKALKGHVLAQDKLLQLVANHLGVDDPGSRKSALSPQDQAMLDAVLNDHAIEDETAASERPDAQPPVVGKP